MARRLKCRAVRGSQSQSPVYMRTPRFGELERAIQNLSRVLQDGAPLGGFVCMSQRQYNAPPIGGGAFRNRLEVACFNGRFEPPRFSVHWPATFASVPH